MKKDSPLYWEGAVLLYKGRNTYITVERSAEGYSHFQKLYVKDMGKIKADFPVRSGPEAKAFAEGYFWNEVAGNLLEKKDKR